jgi:[ribosomal protein S18]-alanine N-acetyltransferase
VIIERTTDERDVDAIVALEAQSFTNPWSRETLVWELRNSDVTFVYVMKRDDGSIVAFCVCWMLFDELHINTVAVDPAERRKRHATELLAYVFQEAASRGVTRATLEVRASNDAARRLYERLGFQVTARRPRYYTNPDEDALILWRNALP